MYSSLIIMKHFWHKKVELWNDWISFPHSEQNFFNLSLDSEEINSSGTSYSSFVDANAVNHSIKVTPDNDLAIVTGLSIVFYKKSKYYKNI